jgi:hypothetical protein
LWGFATVIPTYFLLHDPLFVYPHKDGGVNVVKQQLTRAAYDALDEVNRGRRFLMRFNRDVKGLDAGYLDQIHALLERFDLRPGQSNKAVDKRTALAEWIKTQREAGLEPEIPPELENEAFRTSYKNLTVEEFRALVDSVRQIAHLGRLKNRLLTAQKQRSYEKAVVEIVQSLTDNAQAISKAPLYTREKGSLKDWVKQGFNAHKRANIIARILDGGKDGGAFWEYFVRTANAAGDKETTMVAEATAKLAAILWPLGNLSAKQEDSQTLGRPFTRAERLGLLLNAGNAGNLQRMQDGNGWSLPALQAEFSKMTAVEVNAAQAIWDVFESYRPQIAEKERRLYGKEPDWVEPTPITIVTADGQTITLRGGYFPIRFDARASEKAGEKDAVTKSNEQLRKAYTSATTRRGFTKTRQDEVKGMPLLLTLDGVYDGLGDVIHDLSWHEWLIDANRLLRSKRIQDAIRETEGPETLALSTSCN